MQALDEAIFNQEAEQTYIGCLLLESELIKESRLKPKNFYMPQLQIIFKAIGRVDESGKPVDIVTVVEALGQEINQIGGVSYLSKLAGAVPTTANIKYYEGIIIEKWKMRRAVQLANRMRNVVLEDKSTEVISKLAQELDELQEFGIDDDEFNLKEKLIDMYEKAQQVRGDITGIDTGYKDLNYLTSGLQRGDLIVIGARPSVGKTAFCLNVGGNAAKKGNAVGIFSLEMGAEQLLARILSAEGNIDGMKMKNPEALFSGDDWEKFTHAMGSINNLPLHIWDRAGVDMQYIRAKARKFRKLHQDKEVLIIIDYLQLITGSAKHGGNRQAEIGEISRQLKVMARDLGVTVVALSQLSRAVENRQDKRPMLSDLRESGQIEQDADIIALLYREDYYDKDSEAKNIIEVIIAKQRNGPVGTVELAFIKEYNKFVSLERHR